MTTRATVRGQLTRFPYSVIAFLVLLAGAALALLWERSDVVAAAWCDGQLMQSTDRCPRYSRQGGIVGWNNFELTLAFARGSLAAVRVVLIIVAVVCLALVVGCLIAWRRNLALAAWLTEEEPVAEHVERAYGRAVGAAIGVALLLAIAPFPGVGSITGGLAVGSVGGIIGGSVVVLLSGGLAGFVLWSAWPRGSSYVGVHDEGVRLARNGRTTFHPWREIQLYRQPRSMTLGVVDEPVRVQLPPEVASAIAGGVTAAWIEEGWRRIQAGERVLFGAVSLTRTSLVVGNMTMQLDQLLDVTVGSDKGGPYWTFRRERFDPATVPPITVANPDALSELLDRLCGVRLPAPEATAARPSPRGKFRS